MSFEWNDENRADVIERYQKAEPTEENSMDIVNEIAEEIGATPNGVRMILSKAEVYVKKTPSSTSASSSSSEGGSKRVSKADAQARLVAALEAKNAEVDSAIIDKLTGKACVYLAEQIENM